MFGLPTKEISLAQLLPLARSFGAKIEDLKETPINSEEETTQALDYLEGACFRDGAGSTMYTATINGQKTVLFITHAPSEAVTKETRST